MKKVENILFDFNGTIVDDLDLCLNLLNTMLSMCNHKKVSKEKYLEIFTFPVIEYYKKAGFIFPKDDFPKLANYFIEEYKKENGNCLLNEGVIEILEYFKKLNKNLVIVSASEINLLKDQSKTYKIEQYFNDISGLDNINASSKIESARSFLKTKNYDLTKTVFIGDTLHDYEVAQELNVECILVCKGHQSKERLQTCHCLVIDNILELKNLLE